MRNIFFSLAVSAFLFVVGVDALAAEQTPPMIEYDEEVDPATVKMEANGSISWDIVRYYVTNGGATARFKANATGQTAIVRNSSGAIVDTFSIPSSAKTTTDPNVFYREMSELSNEPQSKWLWIVPVVAGQLMCYSNSRHESRECSNNCASRRQQFNYRSGVCGFRSNCLCF